MHIGGWQRHAAVPGPACNCPPSAVHSSPAATACLPRPTVPPARCPPGCVAGPPPVPRSALAAAAPGRPPAWRAADGAAPRRQAPSHPRQPPALPQAPQLPAAQHPPVRTRLHGPLQVQAPAREAWTGSGRTPAGGPECCLCYVMLCAMPGAWRIGLRPRAGHLSTTADQGHASRHADPSFRTGRSRSSRAFARVRQQTPSQKQHTS